MSVKFGDQTEYPDWPESFKGYGDGPFPDFNGGPDPAEVVAWQKKRGTTVSEVCKYFGLSRVQVVRVLHERLDLVTRLEIPGGLALEHDGS